MNSGNHTSVRGWFLLGMFGLGIMSPLGWTGSGHAQEAEKKDGPAVAPEAESVLRRVADFYKKAKTIAVDEERAQSVGAQTAATTSKIAFQRPNRFSVRMKAQGGTLSVVSDGKKMFVSIPDLKKYTENDAPESFDALGTNPIVASMMQGSTIVSLFAADPYGKLMEGVKTVKYVGTEAVDGVKMHRLALTQDQFDWEMWVPTDGDPLVRRVHLDLSKALRNMPGAEKLKNMKFGITDDLKNWRIDQPLGDDAFAFLPPKDSEKVDSFLKGMGAGGEETVSPLLGEKAPEVDLKRLDEGRFALGSYHGKSVVMLDFWATWCGPCVMELPILAEVAQKYKDKGVVFCAVNLRETPKEIREFLKEKKLEIPVALDSDGDTGTAYHAQAIPTLVLIDKAGIVQVVHVGYNPEIKATLSKELDALLEGKDLAKEILNKRKQDDALAAKGEGMERAWSVTGAYSSVATDAENRIVFALQTSGDCDVLEHDGKKSRTFRVQERGKPIVRVARLAGKGEGVLTFSLWGPAVVAWKTDGTKLWTETGGQGIDDVWAADLNGDGIDEVIVGYNGNTGLHVFSAEGKRLWKRADLGNVWHVTACDLDGKGQPNVVCTSAEGKVHVSSPRDGTALRTLDAGIYANMIRSTPPGSIPSAKGAVLLVVGSGNSGEAVVGLTGDGKVLWTTKLPTDAQHCDSMSVSPDGTLAAAGMRGGRVCVVEVASGRIIAQIAKQGTSPMVAWAAADKPSSPLVLVATGSKVNAFRLSTEEASPQKKK